MKKRFRLILPALMLVLCLAALSATAWATAGGTQYTDENGNSQMVTRTYIVKDAESYTLETDVYYYVNDPITLTTVTVQPGSHLILGEKANLTIGKLEGTMKIDDTPLSIYAAVTTTETYGTCSIEDARGAYARLYGGSYTALPAGGWCDLGSGFLFRTGTEGSYQYSSMQYEDAIVVRCPKADNTDLKENSCQCATCGAKHRHSAGEDGESIDPATGKYTICGEQYYYATYTHTGGTDHATTFAEAYEKVKVDGTIKLLADTSYNFSSVGQLTKQITLNLNGHKLTCTGNNVQIKGDVTISGGTIGGYGLQIAGGTVVLTGGVTVEKDVDVIGGTLNVENATIKGELTASSTVNVKGGSVKRLTVMPGQTVTLSGGSFEAIGREGKEEESRPTFSDTQTFDKMLASGYAYQKSDNSFVKLSEVSGKDDTSDLDNVTVVKCTSHACEADGSQCAYCNTALVARVSNDSGKNEAYTTFSAATSGAASGDTITLLKDVTETADTWTLEQANVLDLNGHTLSIDYIYVGTVGDFPGSETEGALAVQDGGTGGTIEGHIGVLCGSASVTGGSVQSIAYSGGRTGTLSGGSFVYLSTGGKLSDLLKTGYAYRYADGESKGSLVDLDTLTDTTLRNVEVVRCTNATMNDDGKCPYCHSAATAALTHDATTTNYLTFNQAYAAAANGDTITLLGDAVYVDDGEEASAWTKNLTIVMCDGEAESGATLRLEDTDGNVTTVLLTGNMTFEEVGEIVGGISVEGTMTVKLGMSINDSKVDGAYQPLTIRSGGKLVLDGKSGPHIGRLVVEKDGSVKIGAKTKLNTLELADAAIADGMTVGDLLAEGWGFCDSSKKWYGGSENGFTSDIYVEKLPVQKLEIAASQSKTTFAYGESVTLTANATLADSNKTATYKWEWDKGDLGTNSTLTLEFDGQNGYTGDCVVCCKVTVDGYTKQAYYEFNVEKATLSENAYNPPKKIEGLTFNGKEQDLHTVGSFNVQKTKNLHFGHVMGTSELGSAHKAAEAGTYTVSWYIKGGDYYKDVGSSTSPVGSFEVTIAPCQISFDSASVTGKVYDGSVDASDKVSVVFNGIPSGQSLVKATDYTVSASFDTANAGKNKTVTVTVTLTNKNYTFANGSKTATVTTTAEIEKANITAPTGLTGFKGNKLSTVTLTGGWAWANPDMEMSAQGEKTFSANYTDTTENYFDASGVSVTVTVSEKPQKQLTVTMTGWTYGGTPSAPQFSIPDGITANILYSLGGGSTPTATMPTDAGSYTVAVQYETLTERWVGQTTFTIARAKLPAPTFDSVSESGKTIGDVTVTADTAKADFAWDDATTTKIEQGKSYSWKLTPSAANQSNYEAITGSCTPWPAPVVSDGSGSSSTKNPDGSTTTTTTTPGGTTASSTTDADGNLTGAEVTVSGSDAAGGQTVTLPVDGVAPATGESAPTITVTIPENSTVTVEIPVEDVTPGTVVVIVNEDGTETVIPATSVTENGVCVTLTGSATIKIVENSGHFDDVRENAYYADAVAWASARGITGGRSGNRFAPNDACTRAQLVTFLYRAAGSPGVDGNADFSDAKSGAYYEKALAWAASLDIVGGYGDGTFGTGDAITRQQMAVILYRFAQAMGLDTAQGGMAVREFEDYESVSGYARAAMQWAVNAGILKGNGNKLMPTAECTRAQIVAMLYRLLAK